MSYTGDGVACPAGPAISSLNAKRAQLEQVTTRCPRDGDKHVSVFSQAPVDNLDTSMRAGARGPTSIDDPVARERISHFDHGECSRRAAIAATLRRVARALLLTRVSPYSERIPERVVHARGAGAHGEFTLHTSLEEFTCAKVLTEVGKTTPTFTRYVISVCTRHNIPVCIHAFCGLCSFSTVLGSSGAAETAREVRGFATKWYTQQGNWDLVGNNVPPFFIQDGVKVSCTAWPLKPSQRLRPPLRSARRTDSCSLTTSRYSIHSLL